MIRMLVITIGFFLTGLESVSAMELQEILKNISSTPEKFVFFTETRTAEFLETPLISYGSLEFKAPNTLIKHLTHPEKSEQRIEGDVLSINQSENIKHTVSLKAHPELAIGINAIRWVLSGNLNALNKNFYVTFKNNEHKWWIILVPNDSEALKFIASILVTGSDDEITQIDLKKVNGDSIKTDLYDHR